MVRRHQLFVVDKLGGDCRFRPRLVYRLNKRWFRLGVEHFDAINFAGIAFYKIGIILLNLVPLIALHLSS